MFRTNANECTGPEGMFNASLFGMPQSRYCVACYCTHARSVHLCTMTSVMFEVKVMSYVLTGLHYCYSHNET